MFNSIQNSNGSFDNQDVENLLAIYGLNKEDFQYLSEEELEDMQKSLPYTKLKSFCSEMVGELFIKNVNKGLWYRNPGDQEPIRAQVNHVLGCGGCKRVFDIDDGKVLLVPNTDTEHPTTIQGYWPRIVDEEIGMSDYLQTMNILGSVLEKVEVSTDNFQTFFPAMLTDSFESLQKKNIFVIDLKTNGSSTLRGENRLFNSLEKMRVITNWEAPISSLKEDFRRVHMAGLNPYGDSMNLAMVQEKGVKKLRYFGFDFTSKREEISVLPTPRKSVDEENLNRRIKSALYDLHGVIVQSEHDKLDKRWWFPPEEDEGLLGTILEKYAID